MSINFWRTRSVRSLCAELIWEEKLIHVPWHIYSWSCSQFATATLQKSSHMFYSATPATFMLKLRPRTPSVERGRRNAKQAGVRLRRGLSSGWDSDRWGTWLRLHTWGRRVYGRVLCSVRVCWREWSRWSTPGLCLCWCCQFRPLIDISLCYKN